MNKLYPALLVAGNDSQIRLQQRVTFAFIVVLPLILTMIMGFAIQSLEPKGPEAKVALIDLDGEAISDRFRELIDQELKSNGAQVGEQAEAGEERTEDGSSPESAQPLGMRIQLVEDLSLDDARQQLDDGNLDGVIVLPEQLSADLSAGRPVQIQVYVPPGDSFQRATVEASVDRLVHLVSQQNPLPLSWTPVAGEESEEKLVVGFSSFTQSVAGNGVMFILLNCMATGGLVILQEKRQNTLSRLLISPLTPGTIILGKTIGVFLVGVAQAIVIFGFGRLVLDVKLGSVLGVSMVTLVFIFVGSSLGLAISAIAGREETVQTICTPVALVMTALGGGMFPMEVAPAWLKPVSLLFPTGWAMDAYRKLMWDGLPWTSILLNVVVLLCFAGAFFLFGISSLRWKR